MFSVKPGVSILGIQAPLVLGLMVAKQAFEDQGYDCVLTSCTDGTHKADSLHYVGLAADLRTKHLPLGPKARVLAQLRDRLSPLGFEVLYEGAETPQEHVHLEYDPTHGRSGA